MTSQFSLDHTSLVMGVKSKTVPILLAGPEQVPYFRCNDAAQVLGYSNYYKAVAKHVRPRQIKTLSELLTELQPPLLGAPATPDQNDLKSRYMTESGLYRLIARSKMAFAEAFQDWVEEEVLPTIRRTGQYNTQEGILSTSAWSTKRAEGIELMKLRNASLKDLIGGTFDTAAPRLYAVVANHINQAILGYTETTDKYKKSRNLGKLSIPDILDMQGQVARCYAESCFTKKISDDLEHLRSLTAVQLFHEFRELKLHLREGFVKTGMGALEQQTLDVDEAKTRKKERFHKQCIQ